MSVAAAKRQLWRVVKSHRWLVSMLKQKPSRRSSTYGQIWSERLGELDLEILASVCDDYVAGRRTIPRFPERLLDELIEETRRRMWRATEQERQRERFALYQAATAARKEKARLAAPIKISDYLKRSESTPRAELPVIQPPKRATNQ